MRGTLLRLLFAGTIVAQAGCGDVSPRGFARSVGGADGAVVFEGLPHPMWEEELLEEERRTKPIRDIHGYSFYKEQLEVSAEDAKRLTEQFADAGTLEAFRGEKLCGGYHPDYAVEWRKGSDSYEALICFGCEEVKVYAGIKGERYDLSKGAKAALVDVLIKYRKNRPERTLD